MKIIKIILIIISFLYISGVGLDVVNAQNPKLDSLWNVYKRAKHDSTRIKLLNEDIGYLYESINRDSAIIFYKNAIEIADRNLTNSSAMKHQILDIFTIQKASSLRYIGSIYFIKGDYENALKYYFQSLNITTELSNSHDIKIAYLGKKGMSNCFTNIGNVYNDQGNYNKAIENYLNSLKIKEEINDKIGMSMNYNNVGIVYMYQCSYDKAIEYYLKALKINQELGNKLLISSNFTNLGNVNFSMGKYDIAKEYFLKALKIFEEFSDKNGMSYCYMGIGNVHNSLGNYEKAIEYFLKSLKLKEDLRDKNGIIGALGNIASLNVLLADSVAKSEFQRLQYLQKTIEFGTKAINLAFEIKVVPRQNEVARTLMIAYKKLGNFKKSIEYAEIYITTKDSMFSDEKTSSLAEMGAKYESEKRELTIQKLEKEQLLQNETIARKNAESKKQRILIFSFLAGFVIILIFSIFLYRLFIQKKLANVILSQQKEEILAQRDEIETQRDLVTVQKEHIEEIHKEVTDSINYAERIQRSFLATKELLDENLNEHFVFFHPKDIVSGDFYWAGKLQNGNFALATADSTGHGVPGAIMSILNISSLEKAVESGICEPSKILNHTRKTIIERLKKDGSPEGGKDGMDSSLISFDFENKKLTYSAANNAIWIVRSSKNLTGFENLSGLGEGVTQSSGLLTDEQDVRVTGDASANHEQQTTNNELFELFPDKMPVGKHDKDQISFTQHTFQLQKGDVIYTLTDGFPDQFGGSKGKKFMTKKLKELLIANCQLPMCEQKQILEETLVDWIGDGEQIDDVTILGIKI